MRALQEFGEEDGIKFPAIEYRYSAIQALLAGARGDNARAREFAKQALAETVKDHSGLRYHPTIGLVGSAHKILESRLKMLVDS